LVKKGTYDTLVEYGVDEPNILTGVLKDSLLIPFAPDLCNTWVASRKFNNYLMYKSAFPECQFVWWGDSGQGDVDMGLRMLDEDRLAEVNASAAGAADEEVARLVARRSVVGVYIQDVVLNDGITPKVGFRERCEHVIKSVYIVDNYIDVGLQMYKQGMLGLASLRRITSDSVAELAAIKIEGFQGSKMIRKAEHRVHKKGRKSGAGNAVESLVAPPPRGLSPSKSKTNLAVANVSTGTGSTPNNNTNKKEAKFQSRSRSPSGTITLLSVKRGSSVSPVMVLPAIGISDGVDCGTTAGGGADEGADEGEDCLSYIWDSRVAEMRYSVSQVNTVLSESAYPLHAVITDALCQHHGPSKMARVLYHDAVLLARYQLDDALEKARAQYHANYIAAIWGSAESQPASNGSTA
jgi:hypothetical protein